MGNYYARFGGGRMEQGPQGYLASRLPHSFGPYSAIAVMSSRSKMPMFYSPRAIGGGNFHTQLLNCFVPRARVGQNNASTSERMSSIRHSSIKVIRQQRLPIWSLANTFMYL